MVMVTETAQLVAAALTRHESKQCGWLRKVSMCAKVEECELETYQCRPCHPSDIQTTRTETLDGVINAEELSSHLETSAKRKKSK